MRIATPSRFSQYDLWAAGQLQSTPRGLYLAGADMGAALAQACGSAIAEDLQGQRAGLRPQTFHFYRCGAWWHEVVVIISDL